MSNARPPAHMSHSFCYGPLRLMAALALTGLLSGNTALAEFKNLFAPNNWKLTNNETAAALDLSEAPKKITFICGGPPGNEAVWTVEIPMDGNITFDWQYTPSDESGTRNDVAGWSAGTAAAELTSPVVATDRGHVTVPVKGGQPFAFWIRTAGKSHAPGRLTIRNFVYNGTPRIRVAVGPTNVLVAFDSMPGRVYRVQACSDLADRQWVDVSPAIMAVDRETFYSIAREAGDKMFYQVMQMPSEE